MNSGYGALLTKVIKINDNTIFKKALTNYGEERIEKEINFYKKLQLNNIDFPVPEIYDIKSNSFHMNFLQNYITCQLYFENNQNIEIINNIINKIHTDLNKLHANEMIDIKVEIFNANLVEETYGKIRKRVNEVYHIIKKYKNIKTVNNIEVLSIDEIIIFVSSYIDNYIDNNNNYKYYLIHGDMHLNNILINPNILDIKYIDPRGYFGTSLLYGMKEYDYAKLYFGLSGYSYFDTKIVNNLDIIGNNINIEIKKFNIENNQYYQQKCINLTKIFIICIWLGNAHCFINNECKLIESYYNALYIATLLIKNVL